MDDQTTDIPDIDVTSDVSMPTGPEYMAYPYPHLLERSDKYRDIYFYILGVIVLPGFLLNALAITVLGASAKLRSTSMGQYLIALAISDTIYLLGELLKWLNTYYDTGSGYVIDVDFMDTSDAWCRMIYSLRYTGWLASAYITVAITAERLICISLPLKAATLSTVGRARVAILCIFACSAGLGFSSCYIMGQQFGAYCGYNEKEIYDAWLWAVVRILSLVLPLVLLSVFTGIIIGKLYEMKKLRQSMTEGPNASKNRFLTGVELQLTTMLLVVVITLLILRTPYTISYNITLNRYTIFEPLSAEENVNITIINQFCDLLNVLNYTINFFLYFASGTTFRRQFMRSFCPCLVKKKKREPETGVSVVTTGQTSTNYTKTEM